MSNIREFPADRQLQKRLTDLQAELSELYDSLQRCFEIQDKIENQLAMKEEWYNEVLERYGNAIGMENIPVGYLEYATKNVALDFTNGEVVFKWEPDSEDEEL
jgi:hypothetical protein